MFLAHGNDHIDQEKSLEQKLRPVKINQFLVWAAMCVVLHWYNNFFVKKLCLPIEVASRPPNVCDFINIKANPKIICLCKLRHHSFISNDDGHTCILQYHLCYLVTLSEKETFSLPHIIILLAFTHLYLTPFSEAYPGSMFE